MYLNNDKKSLPNNSHMNSGRMTKAISRPSHTRLQLQQHDTFLMPFVQLNSICPCDGSCPRCKSAGNTGSIPLIQPRLKVNQPVDYLEREADKVANQIVTMPDSRKDQIKLSAVGSEERIEQKCSTCMMKKDQLNIGDRATSMSSGLDVPDELTLQINNKGDGRVLDNNTKSFMESQFDYNFSDVRIHDDSESQQLAGAINARAFTKGNDIFLGRNESSSNRHLMAHELTHVVQQKNRNQNVLQREIVTYNLPVTKEKLTGHIYETYSPDSFIISNALRSLLASGKVRYSDRGTDRKFFNVTASKTEISTALSTAGIVNSMDLADVLMDNHNEYKYASQVVTKSTGRILYFIKVEEFYTAKDVIERQYTRHLTNFEESEAKLVYGNNLKYNEIILDEDPFMTIGDFARTTPSEINFPIGSFGTAGFMPWLIHELAHSWQYEHGTWVTTTLWHAVWSTYAYGKDSGLVNANRNGKKLRDFNTEQQADIARDYYIRLKAGLDIMPWIPYIQEFQLNR